MFPFLFLIYDTLQAKRDLEDLGQSDARATDCHTV